jgi:hypothetical protein
MLVLIVQFRKDLQSGGACIWDEERLHQSDALDDLVGGALEHPGGPRPFVFVGDDRKMQIPLATLSLLAAQLGE